MILDRKGRPLVRNRPGDRVTFDLSQDRELAEDQARRERADHDEKASRPDPGWKPGPLPGPQQA